MSFYKNYLPTVDTSKPESSYDMYDAFGGVDPFAPIDLFGGQSQAYQPPSPEAYQDPYREEYQDPYAAYGDPYEEYSSPFSNIDLFGPGRFQPQSQMMSSNAKNTGNDQNVYAGGTPGFDERTGQYIQQPVETNQSGVASIGGSINPSQAPTYYAGDKAFGSRLEAVNYARNVLGDPSAVEFESPGDDRRGAFYVGDSVFTDRNQALDYATNVIGRPSAMQFARLGQSNPSQLSEAEEQLVENRRLEGLRNFEEARQRSEKFKERKQQLRDQYSGRDIQGGYGLDVRGLGNVRFKNLQEAMTALRELNAGGMDPNNLAVDYDRLVNMGGGPTFAIPQGANQSRIDMPRFTSREDAINYLMAERGLNRDVANRRVQQKN